MESSEESLDKICSWDGCNLVDPAAAGPAREPHSTVHPAGVILTTLRGYFSRIGDLSKPTHYPNTTRQQQVVIEQHTDHPYLLQ